MALVAFVGPRGPKEWQALADQQQPEDARGRGAAPRGARPTAPGGRGPRPTQARATGVPSSTARGPRVAGGRATGADRGAAGCRPRGRASIRGPSPTGSTPRAAGPAPSGTRSAQPYAGRGSADARAGMSRRPSVATGRPERADDRRGLARLRAGRCCDGAGRLLGRSPARRSGRAAGRPALGRRVRPPALRRRTVSGLEPLPVGTSAVAHRVGTAAPGPRSAVVTGPGSAAALGSGRPPRGTALAGRPTVVRPAGCRRLRRQASSRDGARRDDRPRPAAGCRRLGRSAADSESAGRGRDRPRLDDARRAELEQRAYDPRREERRKATRVARAGRRRRPHARPRGPRASCGR